ncbi:retrovirus-related pol polyprotein from transposon TNT 1-94 [Tanacetum coccineum]
MKNNPICKDNASKCFSKRTEPYHEIQELKAQMHRQNMEINGIKETHSVTKGKSVETHVSQTQLKSYQVKDKVVPNISQVKFTKKEVEDNHRISSISKKTKSVTACNDSLNSRTSNVNAVCADCGKCVFNSDHDACVSRYLKDVNARTKKPKVVPISASKPKRKANKSVATPHKKTVAPDTTIQKSKKTALSKDGKTVLLVRLLEARCFSASKLPLSFCLKQFTYRMLYSEQIIIISTHVEGGYRDYNYRTTLNKLKSIHIKFDEIKEMMSDHNSSDLANHNRQEIFVEMSSLGLQIGESSSRNIDNTDVHSFQPQSHDYRWTKDHPLEQVRGNPTMPVQTRRQLATDPEMCMYSLSGRNKKDEDQTVIRNKARLVAKGYAQKRVLILKNHLLQLLAWKQFRILPKGSLIQIIPEKDYASLRKALYGLKQAPRAWYDELSNFLMSKGFTKGTIDPTLFKIKYGEDILLVQIYVDDIIFGSTNPKYSKRFEKLMHSRFEMSLMGEMKFFLGLQIHQSPKGIFINQAKYALEILKKHNMDNCHSIGTPLATKPKLDVDLSGEPVDQSDYHSKIGSLMYLTSSRPDLVQAVCYCARYQARPTQKHLKEVKRIFKYLKGTINMGLWYPKDSGFELTAFSRLNHADALNSVSEKHFRRIHSMVIN